MITARRSSLRTYRQLWEVVGGVLQYGVGVACVSAEKPVTYLGL